MSANDEWICNGCGLEVLVLQTRLLTGRDKDANLTTPAVGSLHVWTMSDMTALCKPCDGVVHLMAKSPSMHEASLRSRVLVGGNHNDQSNQVRQPCDPDAGSWTNIRNLFTGLNGNPDEHVA